jgi:hypothetical protein
LSDNFQELHVDLRKNKRYRLKAAVTFSWEHSNGSTIRGEGYTRDISPNGVFVLTGNRLPSGTAVTLEVSLPPLREKHSGASLRTHGHVIRSEDKGFAAVADMGFRMQFSENRRSQSFEKTDGGGQSKNEAHKHDRSGQRFELTSRFRM